MGCTGRIFWGRYRIRTGNLALTRLEIIKRAFIFTIKTSIFDNLPVNTLGERIRKTRLEKGLFQEDLAKLLNVTETTIINWEKERIIPKQANEQKVSHFLMLTP